MKTKNVLPVFLSIVLAGMMLGSCSTLGEQLRREEAKNSEVSGTFTLILIGGNYTGDVETLAILEKEGAEYTFEPYEPAYDYKVKKGIKAADALAQAETFVSDNPSYLRSFLSSLVDNKGSVLGYEVRPLYMPIEFGTADILDVVYTVRDKKVLVYVRLKSHIKELRDGDGMLQRKIR